jgi:hypothetical protein
VVSYGRMWKLTIETYKKCGKLRADVEVNL